MTEELHLVDADYSACARCKYIGNICRADIDYCTKPIIPRNPGDFIGVDIDKYYEVGCNNFEWNGITVHEEVYRRISTDPRFSESKLLQIKDKNLVGKLTWLEIMYAKRE